MWPLMVPMRSRDAAVGGDEHRGSFNKHVNYRTIPRRLAVNFARCFWGYTGNEKSYPSCIWIFLFEKYAMKIRIPVLTQHSPIVAPVMGILGDNRYTVHMGSTSRSEGFPSTKNQATKNHPQQIHPGGLGFDSKFKPQTCKFTIRTMNQ